MGWKGPDKYIAVTPQVFDLWTDPQERFDIVMNSFTERVLLITPLRVLRGEMLFLE
jgi:arylsulfatase